LVYWAGEYRALTAEIPVSLVDESERVVDLPEEFNQLALAFPNAIADASGNRVLQATLASLG
jgi:DNA-binding FadR family transcriptional regulator